MLVICIGAPIAVFRESGATRCTISFVGAQRPSSPIDLQLYIDGVSLALIWSNPVRFQCPRCGADHETKVGAANLEPLYSNLIKRSLKPLTLQPPEDTLSARGVSTPRHNPYYAESVSDVLARAV